MAGSNPAMTSWVDRRLEAIVARISVVGEGDIWPKTNPLQPITDCLSGTSCAHVFYEGSGWIALILLLIIGGGCALMAGRSVARGWEPEWLAVAYGLLLTFAVRFLHFGLLKGTLMTPYYFLIDAIVLMLLALAGYRYTRAAQMATQYPWLYRRSGLFGWSAVPSGAK